MLPLNEQKYVVALNGNGTTDLTKYIEIFIQSSPLIILYMNDRSPFVHIKQKFPAINRDKNIAS